MAREKFPYRTDRAIEFVAPADEVTQTPLNFSDSGATCSFKVYDPNKDESLSGAEATGQTVLSTVNAGIFVVGDVVEVNLDDETTHASSVTAVDPAAGTITIADALTGDAASGNRVRVLFGSLVSMSEYGTAVYGKRDYGFRGTFAYNHPAQILDQEINVEVTFNGGAGLVRTDIICAVIKPAKECDC